MIRHLYIRNFVLIDEVNLDFSSGFSAFIGETGAGKSILIDAISLLQADRASASYVSKGADKAIIEGTFELSPSSHAYQRLAEAGFDVQDETTFTREISASGKSTARIDHRIVTLSLMKDVLRDEIDIHGQRDNAYLLNTSVHIHLLDEYLQDGALLNETKDAYRSWKKITDERDAALKETYSEADLEYFQYEINEIETADLKPGEEEELEEKEKQYKAVKASLEKLNAIVSLYDDSLSDELYELNKTAQSLEESSTLDEAKSTINDSCYAIQDAVDTFRKSLDDMDLSEDDVNAMEERLFTIQKLKRKYGHSIEEILEKKAELEKQVEIISHRKEYVEEMNAKADRAFALFRTKAEELSKIRHAGRLKLDKAVAENLRDLSLPNARFVTDIRNCDPNENGMDRVEFLISMNKGQDPRPLASTASGGELSRLMLGLKVIFTSLQHIQTVIFDEIDTGVSGPVATAIGRKMAALAQTCQVFSVTHLAQVAACAKQLYLVSKSDENGITHTHVDQLDYKESISQLALIASGEITKTSSAAAKELLDRNQKR